jgi:hypothetical protein
MLRDWLGTACAMFALAVPCYTACAQQPGFSQIDVHNPFSPHYVPLTPLSPGPDTTSGLGAGGSSGARWVFGPGFYPYYPVYSVPFPVFAPPLAPGPAPAPAAANGIGGGNVMAPVGKPAVAVAARAPLGGFGLLAPNVQPKPRQKPRTTNAEARARSQRFIVLGDGYFGKQQYSDAYQRYKLAAQAALDMSDGFLRQGFALVALGRYESAARNFKRGIALEPDWAQHGFRLGTLYPENGLAKAAHIEALAQEVVRAPSSDVLFLLGVMLYFDGQSQRATPFFVRSRELSAGDDAHLGGFLRKLAPQAPADEAPAPAVVPVAKRDAAPAPPATAVLPFSKLPTAPVDTARAKKGAPRPSDQPGRDL